MAYIIDIAKKAKINFSPSSVVEEVLQNVRYIIATTKYSVPLDRRFGIDGSVVDLPMNIAKAKYTNEIFQAIKRYEPRAIIDSINFTGEETGRLVPLLEVRVNV